MTEPRRKQCHDPRAGANIEHAQPWPAACTGVTEDAGDRDTPDLFDMAVAQAVTRQSVVAGCPGIPDRHEGALQRLIVRATGWPINQWLYGRKIAGCWSPA